MAPKVSTITSDATAMSRFYSDLDYYRRRYSMKEYDELLEEILIQFVAPKIIAYEEYRFYLLQNSEVKSIVPKNFYRPDYVSYEEYGTTNLWSLILYINDIPTIEDFSIKDILIPSYASVLNISKDMVKRSFVTEIVPQWEIEKKETAKLFYKVPSIPSFSVQPIVSPFSPSDMYFNRENFLIDNFIARSMYVDLQFEPVQQSLIFKLKDNPNYLYGKHYVIIKGNGGQNRITWDPRFMLEGIGLVDVIEEGNELEIQYARKVIT